MDSEDEIKFKEKIQINSERMMLLKHSESFQKLLSRVKIEYRFIPNENNFIELQSKSKENLSLRKQDLFENKDSNALVHIVDDEEVKYIFTKDFNYAENAAPQIAKFISSVSHFTFISKDEIKEGKYKNQNVFIYEVDKDEAKEKEDEFNKILERIRYLNCVNFTIKLPTSSQTTAIDEYFRIGKLVAKHDDTKMIHHLLTSITTESNISPFIKAESTLNFSLVSFDFAPYDFPFIFVCSSSGTGKTQLPFSLDIPMLYFIYNKALVTGTSSNNKQQIYLPFLSLSSKLLECVDKDVEFLNTIEDLILSDVESYVMDHSFFIFGFIVQIYKAVNDIQRENKKNNIKEHWIYSQLKINGDFRIEKMDLIDAFDELYKITKENTNCRPVIFLDECEKSKFDPDFLLKYKFLRKCLRCLKCLPVFMGTNAKLTNFINQVTADGSRKDGLRPWCYMIFRLAPMDKRLIANKIEEFYNNRLTNANESKKHEIIKFTEIISKTMENERPFFINLFFEFLKNDVTIQKFLSNEDDISILKILQQLMFYIFETYTYRKNTFSLDANNSFKSYNYSNLVLTEPEFWRKTTSDYNNEEFEKVEDYENCDAIHRHIAKLYVPSDILNYLGKANFFAINITEGAFPFLGRLYEKKINFFIQQIFESFKDESIGQLSYLGVLNYNQFFVDRVMRTANSTEIGYSRISCASVLKEFLFKRKELKHKSITDTKNWTSLEILSSLAILISSHVSGLKGVSFDYWIQCFLRELISDKMYDSFVFNDSFLPPDLFWKNYRNTIIPFLAPSINALWNIDFKDYLLSQNACIGTLHADLGNKSVDFFVDRYHSNNRKDSIISGECKYRKDFVSFSLVCEVIDKLWDRNSLINFIICNKVRIDSDNISMKKILENSKLSNDEINNIYLYKVERNNDVLYLKSLYEGNNFNPNKLRGFIIISIEDIE